MHLLYSITIVYIENETIKYSHSFFNAKSQQHIQYSIESFLVDIYLLYCTYCIVYGTVQYDR